MSTEMKEKLFSAMLNLEHLSDQYVNEELFDGVDYWSESNGAYKMIEILGLSKEYINWSYGK